MRRSGYFWIKRHNMKYLELPVYQQRETILAALEKHNVIVVESPTGSGKTTQLPVILHEAGYDRKGVIGGTQPRRIAAMSVSEFIRRQLRETNGTSAYSDDIVGYKMRFEDTTTPATVIKIMTDGILLQELKADPMLSRYSVMIVDEAHERSLNIDFILGLLKRVVAARPDFKVIISSATLNTTVFSEYFGNCPILRIETKMYPVDVKYEPLEDQNDELLIDTIENIVVREVRSKPEGDFLIFLSGEKIIKDCVNRLEHSTVYKDLHVMPLYGRLTKEEQELVFENAPDGKRKVVVATNIAETSITIDGITCVIDSGLAKLSFYNPRTYTSSLVETLISRASCKQRKGRAGRTRPGTCYRLYGKTDYEQRSMYTTEEIYRTDLSEVVLRMAELGIKDFESFDFISQPGIEGIRSAVETLLMLDALNTDRNLTQIGSEMVRFPLLPRHSRILVEGMERYPQVLEELLIGTAFITTNSPYMLPAGLETEARAAHHQFRDKAGDFISYLKLYRAFTKTKNKEQFCKQYFLDERSMREIVNIKHQLEEIVVSCGVLPGTGGPYKDYLCGLAKGLIQFVCVDTKREGYRSLTAKSILIHPGSVMFRERPEFIVAAEIVKTSRTFARSVSSLKREWLQDISPTLYQQLMKGGSDRKRERDTSWELRIGSTPFKLKPYKGNKKLAILPWEQFSSVLKKGAGQQDLYFPGNIRGVIMYKNHEIMTGEKLHILIRVTPILSPEKRLDLNWKGRRNLNSGKGLSVLIGEIETNLLKLVVLKKNSPQLGFVSLNTDATGNYWFQVSKNFFSACESSLGSMEVLIDEIRNDSRKGNLTPLNAVYRTVSSYLDV